MFLTPFLNVLQGWFPSCEENVFFLELDLPVCSIWGDFFSKVFFLPRSCHFSNVGADLIGSPDLSRLGDPEKVSFGPVTLGKVPENYF